MLSKNDDMNYESEILTWSSLIRKSFHERVNNKKSWETNGGKVCCICINNE